MSRRGGTKIHVTSPDPIYESVLVAKLINRAMKNGKKSVIQKQIYNAFEIIKEKAGKDPLEVFNEAIENIKPTMEVRSRRVGGAAYQVPSAVRGPRRESLAIRWLIIAANSKSNSEFHTFAEKIASEILDATKGEGAAMKKKTDMERIAEANRAFAHFRW